MCGIIFSYNIPEKENIKILKSLGLRGRDSYGIKEFNIKKTKNFESKEMKNISDVDIKKIKLDILIANSRSIPTTEYESGAGFDIKNQQPFGDDRYVVVHNGIISNDKELKEKFDLKCKTNVDSEILPYLFSKIGVVEGLRLLEGSFSIICFDKWLNEVYAAKNFTPLRYMVKDYQILFVSLEEMTNLETKEFPPYSCVKLKIRNNGEIIQQGFFSLYKNKRNKKVLVICSSGIDSTTTSYLYKYLGYEVKLLHFKYGASAEEVEEFAIKKIANELNCELIIFNAHKVFEPFKDVSRLLNQNSLDEKDKMKDAETTLSYVPNRNAIFAMIGAGIAEMLKCDTLAYGGQQMDSVYPDNNPTYTNAVDELLKYSLNWNTNIKFTAPLIHLNKHEIVALGNLLNVNFDMTVPCYHPKIINDKIVRCHKCGCCSFADNAHKMVKEKEIIKKDELDKWIGKYVKWYV